MKERLSVKSMEKSNTGNYYVIHYEIRKRSVNEMSQVKETLKKNTMVIALIVVAVFFTFMTDGALLLSSNITNLIAQNGYVVILAVGMLLCILTGGNIDLSVGSIVCLVGAVVGKLMVNGGVNMWVAIGPVC